MQKTKTKSLKIYEAYLYGTVEEFVMFTLIYFNRQKSTCICITGDLSMHPFLSESGCKGLLKCIPFLSINLSFKYRYTLTNWVIVVEWFPPDVPCFVHAARLVYKNTNINSHLCQDAGWPNGGNKLTTMGCLRNSSSADSLRVVRSTPWNDCWYLQRRQE